MHFGFHIRDYYVSVKRQVYCSFLTFLGMIVFFWFSCLIFQNLYLSILEFSKAQQEILVASIVGRKLLINDMEKLRK